MYLILTRDNPSTKSTEGFMTVDGEQECYTLEPAVDSDTPPIPAGVYPIDFRPSPDFQRLAEIDPWFKPYCDDMPHIDYKPDSITMIHVGNVPHNTKDCVLVGQSRGQDFIGSSKAAFAELYGKMMDAKNDGELISIEIQDSI